MILLLAGCASSVEPEYKKVDLSGAFDRPMEQWQVDFNNRPRVEVWGRERTRYWGRGGVSSLHRRRGYMLGCRLMCDLGGIGDFGGAKNIGCGYWCGH